MKLSQLKVYIAQYDTIKGIGRKIFGDAEQIKALKLFIYDKEISLANQVDDPDISLEEFKEFASQHNFNLNLSAAYLNNDSTSANIFNTWQMQKISRETLENSSESLSQQVQKTYTNPLKLDLQEITIKNLLINLYNLSANEITINMTAETFSKQPEYRKKLSTTRFWKQPENLVEASAQTVTSELLKNPSAYNCKALQLPQELKEKIFTYLHQAEDKMKEERFILGFYQQLSEYKDPLKNHKMPQLVRNIGLNF